jgi:hypothetical protein
MHWKDSRWFGAEAQSKLGEVQSNRNKLLTNIKQDEELLERAQDSHARKELKT